MTDDVRAFYDDLAADYHLIWSDWDASVRHQGEVLDALIATASRPGAHRILDPTCGIGTQAIGLALRGHTVVGTDLSPAEIERARAHASRFGVDVEFAVADVREVSGRVEGPFDAAVSCDNSLPHLADDADLDAALASVRSVLRDGAVLVASVRDYDALSRERPVATPVRVHTAGGHTRIVFQRWDWADDGRSYTIEHFLLRPSADGWTVRTRTAPYRALLRAELEASLERSRYEVVGWHTPEQTGYHQPVVVARAV